MSFIYSICSTDLDIQLGKLNTCIGHKEARRAAKCLSTLLLENVFNKTKLIGFILIIDCNSVCFLCLVSMKLPF